MTTNSRTRRERRARRSPPTRRTAGSAPCCRTPPGSSTARSSSPPVKRLRVQRVDVELDRDAARLRARDRLLDQRLVGDRGRRELVPAQRDRVHAAGRSRPSSGRTTRRADSYLPPSSLTPTLRSAAAAAASASAHSKARKRDRRPSSYRLRRSRLTAPRRDASQRVLAGLRHGFKHGVREPVGAEAHRVVGRQARLGLRRRDRGARARPRRGRAC